MTDAAAGPADLAVLRRLEAQLHEALADGGEVLETPGFRLHVWRTPDPFYRNVAVPRAGGRGGWAPALEGLRALCARHERRPRVEFFAELWPGLATALAAAGFAVEAEAPVLVAEAPPPPPSGPPPAGIAVERLGPATPRPMLQACLEAAAATFHEPAAILAPGELERLQEGLAGGAVRSAVVLAGGAPVSGASLAGRGPVAELLGVWTAPAHRRRGLARAVCRDLLSGFFRAGGELAWLTASGEASRSLYEGLGFRACGTHLDCADLGPAAALPARP